MSATPDRPREADARALYDEAVAEGWTVATAIEAAEARGLAPVGWSDGDAVGRGWWCYHCKGTGERNRGYKGCVACERPDTRRSTGMTSQPATVRDLCAVLSLGWNEGTREVDCARCAVPLTMDDLRRVAPPSLRIDPALAAHAIRRAQHRVRGLAGRGLSVLAPDARTAAAAAFAVHKLVELEPFAKTYRTLAESGARQAEYDIWCAIVSSDAPPPCPDCAGAWFVHVPRGHDAAEDFARQVAHELRAYGYTGQARRVVWRPVDVIRDALDTGPVWGEGQRTTLYADGRLRHTPDVNRPGEQQWTHLPAARALAAMGLRLGGVLENAVVIVVATWPSRSTAFSWRGTSTPPRTPARSSGCARLPAPRGGSMTSTTGEAATRGTTPNAATRRGRCERSALRSWDARPTR